MSRSAASGRSTSVVMGSSMSTACGAGTPRKCSVWVQAADGLPQSMGHKPQVSSLKKAKPERALHRTLDTRMLDP
eukprot:scaffold120559_cov63-Phaeocystis_antarctica.AAC.6